MKSLVVGFLDCLFCYVWGEVLCDNLNKDCKFSIFFVIDFVVWMIGWIIGFFLFGIDLYCKRLYKKYNIKK